MDSKAEEEGFSTTKTTATTTSLSMPSAEAKLGLQVEDLWDVQAPQLDPADNLNTCFEEIPVFSFPRASFSSVEIDSESSLAEAVRVLAKHRLLSAPVVDADAPKDAWVDIYIGVVEFVGIVVWILQQRLMEIPVSLNPCTTLIPLVGPMHTKKPFLTLLEYCSFMIPINASCLGFWGSSN